MFNFKKLEWFQWQLPRPYVIATFHGTYQHPRQIQVLSKVRFDIKYALLCNILNGRAARQGKEIEYTHIWIDWNPDKEYERRTSTVARSDARNTRRGFIYSQRVERLCGRGTNRNTTGQRWHFCPSEGKFKFRLAAIAATPKEVENDATCTITFPGDWLVGSGVRGTGFLCRARA